MNDNKLEVKMKILQELNTDDSRYLFKICKAYKNYKNEMNILKNTLKIEISHADTNIQNGLINLDDIDCEKYFNTNMKRNIKSMVESIINVDEHEFYKNKNICKNIIYKKREIPLIPKNEKKIDIVELIKILDINKVKNVNIVARNISDENIVKYCELTKALEIISNTDVRVRNKIIYDYVCECLDKDFIQNQYCDFINDKCVAQRHFNLYPVTKKDGCCFKQITKCNHLTNGSCNVKCMACKLFSCPYLTKRGVGYWAGEFVLLNAFMSRKQRKHLVFDFYKSEDFVLDKINKER